MAKVAPDDLGLLLRLYSTAMRTICWLAVRGMAVFRRAALHQLMRLLRSSCAFQLTDHGSSPTLQERVSAHRPRELVGSGSVGEIMVEVGRTSSGCALRQSAQFVGWQLLAGRLAVGARLSSPTTGAHQPRATVASLGLPAGFATETADVAKGRSGGRHGRRGGERRLGEHSRQRGKHATRWMHRPITRTSPAHRPRVPS